MNYERKCLLNADNEKNMHETHKGFWNTVNNKISHATHIRNNQTWRVRTLFLNKAVQRGGKKEQQQQQHELRMTWDNLRCSEIFIKVLVTCRRLQHNFGVQWHFGITYCNQDKNLWIFLWSSNMRSTAKSRELEHSSAITNVSE